MARSAGVSGRVVGRARELAAVALAREGARSGHGSFLAVSGPEGIGKTWLCEAAAIAARSDGFGVGWSAAWPLGDAPPAWPWHEAIAQLRTGPPPAAGDQAAAPAGFAGMVATVDELRAATAERPGLVIIDDLQLADRATLEVARFVARQIRALPVVVVVAHRPVADGGEVAAILADLDADATRFELGGLEGDEIRTLLEARGVEALADADVDFVRRVTDGQPRLLELAASRAGRSAPEGSRRGILLREFAETAAGGLGPTARILGASAAVLGRTKVGDLAEIAEVPITEMPGAMVELELAGLARIEAAAAVAIVHPAAVDVLAAPLSAVGAIEVHARAAEVLGRRGAASIDDRVRLAHHALAAGVRSSADAARAVALATEVAAELAAVNDHARAVELLAAASDLHRDGGIGRPRAALQAAHANALLRGGQLAAARPLFEAAALAAEVEDDAESRALAAIGLGGVWLNEHRSPIDRQRILALQQRALDALPEDATTIRLRLEVRLAAESAYTNGDLDAVRAAVAAARSRGEPALLAEALSLYHHVLLGPPHADERVRVARECLDVAAAAGDDLSALMGLMWLTVDLFLAGDPQAERWLTELRERAEALPCRTIVYVARTIQVMAQIRAGDLDGAEAEAAACFEYGSDVGDADALAYYGSQLFVIRWLQGRGREVLGAAADTAASPTLTPANHAFTAAFACLAAESGDPAQARAALDRLHAAGMAGITQSSAWLVTIAVAMEAAALLGDRETAAAGADALAPFAQLPVMGSLAVVCLGSARRPLGLAARTMGDLDAAVGHLAAAVAHSEQLGNRPYAALNGADLADALVTRDEPGDRSRAVSCLRSAIVIGEAAGLEPRVSAWRHRLEEIEAGAVAAPTRPATGTITRRGASWVFAWGDRRAEVPDRLGLGYLAQLLVNPEREIAATTLVGGAGMAGGGVEQAVLDDRAMAAYRQQIRDLQEDLAEAEADADTERAHRLQLELDALVAELSGQVGLGGRSRAFNSAAERARTAVRKAVRRALDQLEEADPELGGALRRSIQTGRLCCYRPGPDTPARWVEA